MAEGLLRHFAGESFEALSAGMEPGNEVHPLATAKVDGRLQPFHNVATEVERVLAAGRVAGDKAWFCYSYFIAPLLWITQTSFVQSEWSSRLSVYVIFLAGIKVEAVPVSLMCHKAHTDG